MQPAAIAAIVPVMEATVSLSAAWRTDPGLVRSHNEDFVAVFEPQSPDDLRHGNLYIVADGVGGADAGEVASQFAGERTLHYFLESSSLEELDNEDIGHLLIEAMQSANTDLRRLAADRDDSRRMATTMVAAAIKDGRAFIGNVGDSRAYRWRNGALVQVTRDQSLVARLVEEGALTPEEALRYPYKNVILYSLGSERRPPIDLYVETLEPGDLLLLCSDGLTRHVDDNEIADILGRELPDAAVDTLVGLARNRGGEDNITVAVIQNGPRAIVQPAGTSTKPEDEDLTLTVAHPRPEVPVNARPAAAPLTYEPAPRIWPLLLVLTAVMVILIFLLWAFIQTTTAI